MLLLPLSAQLFVPGLHQGVVVRQPLRSGGIGMASKPLSVDVSDLGVTMDDLKTPINSLEVEASGFVSLKGLRPIKTPAAKPGKKRALGPSHAAESGSSSEDDAPKPGGYSRKEMSPSSPLASGDGARDGGPDGAKVQTSQMAAAGALKMPGLSPIKVKKVEAAS